MLYARIKSFLAGFREKTDGSFAMETVIVLPLLFWMVAATYEFFEVHRYKSARIKATYTVADLVSRQETAINDTFIDNMKVLFDEMTNDSGETQLRVSIVRYDENTETYDLRWSEVRGTGHFLPLTDADVATDHQNLPILRHGEEVIIVESNSSYDSLFKVGLADAINMNTRTFSSLRFAGQLQFEGVTLAN